MNHSLIKAGMKDKSLVFKKSDSNKAIRTALDMMGETKYIIICMEEITELLEVIGDNIDGAGCYIHTVEEIADVACCCDILQIIFDVKSKELAKPEKCKKKRANMKAHSLLCQSHMILSKYLRHVDHIDLDDFRENKIIPCINMKASAVEMLKNAYGIKDSEIKKIRAIKTDRLKKRIENGDL